MKKIILSKLDCIICVLFVNLRIKQTEMQSLNWFCNPKIKFSISNLGYYCDKTSNYANFLPIFQVKICTLNVELSLILMQLWMLSGIWMANPCLLETVGEHHTVRNTKIYLFIFYILFHLFHFLANAFLLPITGSKL